MKLRDIELCGRYSLPYLCVDVNEKRAELKTEDRLTNHFRCVKLFKVQKINFFKVLEVKACITL